MQKQSACIKCKNNLFIALKVTLCIWSKQPCTIKTIIYKYDILRCKKVQSLTKQFKELFSLACYFFALNLPSSALNYLKTAFILTHYEPSNFSKYFVRALMGQSYGTVHVSYLCNSEFAPFNLKTV